jgi:hypothetical protein
MTWEQQENPDYCGPASARMIIAPVYSPYQSTLAADIYLVTNLEDNTPWYYCSAYPRPMESTLDSFKDNDYTTYQSNTNLNNSEAALKNIIQSSINYSEDGIAANWIIKPGNIPQWDISSPIYHWVAVNGYRNYANWIYIMDPYYGYDTFPSCSTYQVTSSNFWTVITQDGEPRGIVAPY